MSHLDQLLSTPPAELIADLKALRDQRAGIEAKEAVLEQLLDMVIQGGGADAEEIVALGAASGIGPLRRQIIYVLRAAREEGADEPGFYLVPQSVHDALVARGNRNVTLDNVRVTMKRMADSGELERPLSEKSLIYGLPGTAEEHPLVLEALAEQFDGGQQR